MTPGQAATLARNEQVIDSATDDLEELEEELNNSIAETLKGKKGTAEATVSRSTTYRSALRKNQELLMEREDMGIE